MTNALTLDIKGMDKVLAEIKAYPQDVEKIINNEFKAFGFETWNEAKRLSPVDEGHLRAHLSTEATNLKVNISANVDYAAYLEFGTKSFAAKYVATLPTDWQAFAAQFKGNGGGSGSFMSFFYTIFEWVQRKGFAATYSIKTHKRSNSKATIKREREAAYLIALKIVKKGIRPHPYLFPAFEKNKLELIKNLKAQLNAKS